MKNLNYLLKIRIIYFYLFIILLVLLLKNLTKSVAIIVLKIIFLII